MFSRFARAFCSAQNLHPILRKKVLNQWTAADTRRWLVRIGFEADDAVLARFRRTEGEVLALLTKDDIIRQVDDVEAGHIIYYRRLLLQRKEREEGNVDDEKEVPLRAEEHSTRSRTVRGRNLDTAAAELFLTTPGRTPTPPQTTSSNRGGGGGDGGGDDSGGELGRDYSPFGELGSEEPAFDVTLGAEQHEIEMFPWLFDTRPGRSPPFAVP